MNLFIKHTNDNTLEREWYVCAMVDGKIETVFASPSYRFIKEMFAYFKHYSNQSLLQLINSRKEAYYKSLPHEFYSPE